MPTIDPEELYDILDDLDLEPTQRISTLISALEESDDSDEDEENFDKD
jgi:hypothetical protein